MGPREEEEVQSGGCGEQAHGAGVPQVVGGGDDDAGQCGDVEFEVDDGGEGLFGAATLLEPSFS